MPIQTRWFIRCALLWLGLGLTAGVAMAADPSLRTWWPTYLHLLVVGWLTQLIFGVAFWLFPRASREHKRGHEGAAWGSLILLNLGMALRVVAEPFAIGSADDGLLLAAAASQLGAALAFVVNIWPRVRTR